MGVIEEVYQDLDTDLSEEEFRSAVQDKVEQMGGLADDETAAMLIAHELTENEVNGIANIKAGMSEVKFLGQVLSIGELRTFDRDDADEGRVLNIDVADETGSIRVAFWDDRAEAAQDELEPGQVLRIKGRPREGYNGLEISADRAELEPDVSFDVTVDAATTISDLTMGQSNVHLDGTILSIEPVRTFERDDGSEGHVSNLVLGDETGRVRVTLWDDRAMITEELESGESIEVIDGYVRERDDALELHVGNRGSIQRIDEDIEYVPDATDISDLEIGETVDIVGVVRSADPKRTFDRDDGSQGQVRNIRVQDTTGDIRVAMWGDKADLEIGPGDEIHLADVEIQDGWRDDIEASAGWRSSISVLTDGTTNQAVEHSPPSPQTNTDGDLSAFGESDQTPDSTPDTESTEIEFTGVVVQTGDPIVLDNGEETLHVNTDTDVTLGQEITVRGVLQNNRLDAHDVTK